MRDDVRFAWRALRHRRAVAFTAVLCLALGLGANTVLFGVVDALLFRPPAGVAEPDELVRVRLGAAAGPTAMGAGPSVTHPQMRAIAEQLSGVAQVAAYAPRTLSLGSGERAEPLSAVIASGNYFDVLGVRPYRGRLFVAGEDDVPGATVAVVLSYAGWKRHFDGDARAIGSTIDVNGVPATVIGVAARGFAGVDLGQPEAWLGMGAAGRDAFGGPSQYTDRTYWLQLLARPRPGASGALLSHAVGGGGRDPYSATPLLPLHTLPLRAMFFAEQRGESPVPVWAIGITLAVLLLACATVANLLLAQGAAREREVAVRLALGAPPRRILRQLLLENLMIAMAAAAAAVLLAIWSARLVRLLPVPEIPRLVDVRVGVFAFGMAAVTTLLFGLVPALWTARGDLDTVLRRGAVRGSGGQSRLQQALMAAQIALSFVLLVGAGLFVSSFRNVLRIDTGFDLVHLLEVSVNLAGRGLSPQESRQLVADITERATTVPGVVAASPASIIPFFLFNRSGFIIPDARPQEDQPVSQLVSTVGADYFTTMGIRMAAGRAFGPTDRAGSEPVAIVSQTMARQFWRDGTALGACIQLSRRHGEACVRIVGITVDVQFQDLRGDPTPVLFLLDVQASDGGTAPRTATIFVRTRPGDPVSIAEPLRRAIQSVHGGLPFIQVRPLDDRVRPSRIPWEVAGTLFTIFGALATALAAVGLHMVVTFMVRQRNRELGIRSALGAPRGAILRLVLARAARVSAIGIFAGAVVALVVTRLLASRLYGVAAAEPVIWIAAAGLLMLVGLAASWLPARAATGLDPLVVLRAE